MKKITIGIMALVLFGYHQVVSKESAMETNMNINSQHEEAVFAGGCFWCTESDFEKVDGVVEVISGYTGGQAADATYQAVSRGQTGHVEAVKVVYDPARVSYEALLDVFWRHVDPTDAGGQFVDRGLQYRSAIFYRSETEREQAEASKKHLAESGPFDKPLATEILPLKVFYPAEAYHQDYYKKNPLRYGWYRSGSGRDQFLKRTWKDWKPTRPTTHTADDDFKLPRDAELRRQLTTLQYQVTRQNGTEPPYRNAFWDNHEAGIYVDILSGEPLFSSTDKFDSGTGWPSFTRPLVSENIIEKIDRGFFMVRTEVRSRRADSHLGHLFKDGPAPTGNRYCINSAALRFIPEADLDREGYGEFRYLFE